MLDADRHGLPPGFGQAPTTAAGSSGVAMSMSSPGWPSMVGAAPTKRVAPGCRSAVRRHRHRREQAGHVHRRHRRNGVSRQAIVTPLTGPIIGGLASPTTPRWTGHCQYRGQGRPAGADPGRWRCSAGQRRTDDQRGTQRLSNCTESLPSRPGCAHRGPWPQCRNGRPPNAPSRRQRSSRRKLSSGSSNTAATSPTAGSGRRRRHDGRRRNIKAGAGGVAWQGGNHVRPGQIEADFLGCLASGGVERSASSASARPPGRIWPGCLGRCGARWVSTSRGPSSCSSRTSAPRWPAAARRAISDQSSPRRGRSASAKPRPKSRLSAVGSRSSAMGCPLTAGWRVAAPPAEGHAAGPDLKWPVLSPRNGEVDKLVEYRPVQPRGRPGRGRAAAAAHRCPIKAEAQWVVRPGDKAIADVGLRVRCWASPAATSMSTATNGAFQPATSPRSTGVCRSNARRPRVEG